MTSYLTRHVFRALLANEPILHRGCLRRRTYFTLRRDQRLSQCGPFRNGRYVASSFQRRAFFNISLFGPNRRDVKDPEMDPGVGKMMELAKRQRMRARLPTKEDVAKAFKAFVRFKYTSRGSIEDTQAELLLRSLRYCLDSKDKGENPERMLLPPPVLGWTASAMRNSMKNPSQHHMELAKALCEWTSTAVRSKPYRAPLSIYVQYLASNGQAHKARDIVVSVLDRADRESQTFAEGTSVEIDEDHSIDESNEAVGQASSTSALPPLSPSFRADLWASVLHGFAQGSSETELLQTLDAARRHIEPHPMVPMTVMLTFYTRRGNAQQIKYWFSEYWKLAADPVRIGLASPEKQGQQVHRVLRWCLQNNELEVGHDIVRQVLSINPPKPVWDAIFVWAAGTGKGVDEIARMIRVMENSNQTSGVGGTPRHADVDTINALVEYAVSKDDPYMAERFIALGRDSKIAPDVRTYILQMEYRLRVNDTDGALVAYKNLQGMDLSLNEDGPTVNRLLVALCKSPRHDFDTIMNIVADLADRRVRIEPGTVSALSILHLNRDEFDDVVDLLNTHAHRFSFHERDGIRDAMLAVCVDPKTPTSRSWDAFALIRKAFDETPRSQRTEIMLNFFKRERSDMAVHVFNSMRTHSRADIIPTIDTYVAAFMAAAKADDLEALEVIHNQLKLDFNINVSTYLNNALILAYSACGQARRSLGYWDDIVASREGPTYNSIHIALRACEKSAFGDGKAKEIWAKLRRMNVELDQSLWASYVAALAGNGNNQQAFDAVEEAEKKRELEVDSFLIGSLFAGGAGQSKQAEIEDWAKARYPHVWEDLLNIGIDEDEAGMRAFRIDRTVTP